MATRLSSPYDTGVFRLEVTPNRAPLVRIGDSVEMFAGSTFENSTVTGLAFQGGEFDVYPASVNVRFHDGRRIRYVFKGGHWMEQSGRSAKSFLFLAVLAAIFWWIYTNYFIQ